MNIGSLEVMLGANTAGLSRAAVNMKRFETQVVGSNAKMQASFQALGSQMMLTGTMVTQFLTVPIALLGGAAVSAFAKFETELSKIVALTGTTQGQVSTWSKSFMNMSKEFGQAPKAIASAMYFIASPALKASTSMNILQAATKGAAIGLGDTKTIANALVAVTNAYGEENINAAKALDIMITSVKNGKWEAEDLAKVIGKILPVAQALGVGFGDVAGSLAAMTLTGKSASEAATQLTRLFSTLIQSPPKAEKVLDDLGISFSSLRTTLREGGVVKLIEELNRVMGGGKLDEIMSTKAYADNIQTIGDVFTNLRALLPVLDMLGPNMKNWTNAIDANTKSAGAANAAWGIVSGTVAVRFNKAVDSMRVSLIGFGETIKEPVINLIQSVARHIENLSNWFQSLSSATQSNIVWWAGLVVTLGPVLLILGTLVGLIMNMGIALSRLGVLMLAHPWVQFTVAAALLVGVLISTYNNYKNLDGVQRALNDVNVKASKSLIDLTISSQRLLNVAKSDLADKKTRLDAISQLNALSPKYLGFINEENVKTKEAATAMQAYLDSLKQVEVYKASIEAQDANRTRKMQIMADPKDSLSGWNDFFDSIGKGYFKHKTYVAYVLKGLDDEYEALLKVTHEYEVQEDLISQFSKIPKSENPLFYIDPKAFSSVEMLGKQMGVIWDKITGTDRTTSKDPMGIWKMTANAANEAKAKLENAAAAAAQFWKDYAGMDNEKKMKTLSELMETSTGRQLTLLVQKWTALDNIKKKQDEIIAQEKQIAANTKMTSLGATTPRNALMDMAKSTGLPNIGENPYKVIKGIPLATSTFQSFGQIVRQTNLDLYQNAEIANKLGASYDKLGKSSGIDILQSALDKLTTPEMMQSITPEQIAIIQTYIGLLDQLKVKQQENTKELNAWKNVFRDIEALANDIGKYLGEGFQKVFQTVTDIIGGVSDFLRLLKDLSALTKVTQAVATTATVAQTAATAIGIPVTLGAAGAQETLAIANTNAAITGAAASISWIPIIGIGLAIAGVIAMVALLTKSHKTSTGMATGGTVPSGFPNDSFPAMLTSGETVVPLAKTAEMFGKGQRNNKPQKVTFEIGVRELIGVLEDGGKLQHSF